MRTWGRCLAAAGVRDGAARGDYGAAARYLRRREPALYTAIRVLGREEYQPHAVAGYAFGRVTDDLCDRGPSAGRAGRLRTWDAHGRSALAGGPAHHPILRAYLRSVDARRTPHHWTRTYLDGARADLGDPGFADEDDVQRHVDRLSWPFAMLTAALAHPGGGSDRFARACRGLAEAWQRADFLTDLHEDLDDGRLYLAADSLDAHGVTRADLEAGRSGAPVRALVRASADAALDAARRAEALVEEMPGPLRPLTRFALLMTERRLDKVKTAGDAVARGPVRDDVPGALALLARVRADDRGSRAAARPGRDPHLLRH
ncbi:squalene/phytoene synthase family protein [Streptomyces sp. NPDC049813]|uniref:squalene/phytoene synthase family protein n=1 Tax=Streptomyces sp. NPDC049813 TaxID=3365597 RepID=UPI00379DDA51